MRFAPRKGAHVRCVRGNWFYRKKIPERWRKVLGKTEWTEALGAISAAEARIRGRALSAEHDRLIADFEATGDEGMRQLRIADLIEKADAEKAKHPNAANVIDTMLGIELRRIGFQPKASDVARWSANFMRAGQGGLVPGIPDDPAEREMTQLLIKKAEKDAAELDASEEDKTLLTALPAFRAMRKQGDEAWRKYVQHVGDFVEFLGGDRALIAVTRADADNFIRHLATTPFKGKLRTGGTVTAYINTLKAYFHWASRRPNWGVENVFKDVDLPKDDRPQQEQTYDSFTDAQAWEFRRVAHQRWLNWTRRAVPGRGRDFRLILDLIMAMGMRPNEVCQLHVSNVIESDGGLLIHVTNVLDKKDPNWKGRVKNQHSVRQLPVPGGLEKVVYAQWDIAKAAGSSFLFPTLADRKDKSKAISNDISDNVKPNCSFADNERLVLYSNRHRFRDLCSRLDMPDAMQQALMGHKDDHPMSSRYGDRNKWNADKRRWINMVFPLVFEPEAESVGEPLQPPSAVMTGLTSPNQTAPS